MGPKISLTSARLRAYRAQTYRLKPSRRLKSAADAVKFVNERGFAYFWPIKGVELPSLWAAAAGNRPVADAHDDPGHVTWGWKDSLLGAKQWFYGKVLRGKATMISLKTLKYFYALSENYGDMHNDYLLQYEEGRLTQEAKAIFEALLAHGRLDTIALRREARMTGSDSNTRFERALIELQAGLKILPVGVAQAGAWRYAFIYELVDRWFPDLAAEARPLGRSEAQAHLTDLYLKSVGAATEAQVAQLFRWKQEEAHRACASVVAQRKARRAEKVAGQAGEWVVTVGAARVGPRPTIPSSRPRSKG
jgi:hypothetical protein